MTLKNQITLPGAFWIQKANCGTGRVSQGKFATGKKVGSREAPSPLQVRRISTQVLRGPCSALPGPEDGYPTTSLCPRHAARANPRLGSICHKALLLSQHSVGLQGLQFFYSAHVTQMHQLQGKGDAGCLSPPWADPGARGAQCLGFLIRQYSCGVTERAVFK